jgi:hypothetical protein
VITGRHDRVVGYADQFRSMHAYPRGTYTWLTLPAITCPSSSRTCYKH